MDCDIERFFDLASEGCLVMIYEQIPLPSMGNLMF